MQVPSALAGLGAAAARRPLLVAVALLAIIGVTVGLLVRDGESGRPTSNAGLTELEAAAAFGASHDLYGGLGPTTLAAAERTASYRELIERAAGEAEFDPDLVEALVFVESAGQPEAVAGGDPAGAAGLTQILAETATSFLGMRVDLAQSRVLTRSIDQAAARGDGARVEQLEAERRAVDDRFDSTRAVAGTIRYLTEARERFGRDDLAFVSYHMGIRNLDGVLRDFVGAETDLDTADLVAREELSYAVVYFGSSPLTKPAVWNRLASFGDDSANYYWKLLAAREIMRLYRSDVSGLEELIDLHTRKASAEEVLHPPEETEVYASPDDVQAAWDDGGLVRIPKDPDRLGFTIDSSMGELARELGHRRSFYRGLRPDALAVLMSMAAQVRAISGEQAPLRVTSSVRDEQYQAVLADVNPEATQGFSLHTTGYAFDVRRQYGSDRQAEAFQFVLDRLELLGLIAWAREPAAIHITVAAGAGERLATGAGGTGPSDAADSDR